MSGDIGAASATPPGMIAGPTPLGVRRTPAG